MKLGIIARADLTGLGVQSRNWVRLLDPQKTVVINSTPFNNNQQHLEWYDGRGGYIVNGFIKPNEIAPIIAGLDAIMTFEIPYNYELFRFARAKGVKTILQNNWEFTDYLRSPELPLPDLMLNHSYWHLDEQKQKWPDITDYCPTPLFVEDYDTILDQNMNRNEEVRRYLHIAGRTTYEDRNGTQDLLEAIKMIPQSFNFELVIKTQTTHIGDNLDPRVKIDSSEPLDEKELYRNFDAVIMPRRYGGACLPMAESLASGLPVIMTDIDPNNKILPKEWLVASKYTGNIETRTTINVFSADHNALADKIVEFDNLSNPDLWERKRQAREIAEKEYSSQKVLEKFSLQLEKLGL